jgi:hypothetical protein
MSGFVVGRPRTSHRRLLGAALVLVATVVAQAGVAGTARASMETPTAPIAPELLTNPSFENGTTGWVSGNPAHAVTMKTEARLGQIEMNYHLTATGDPGASVAQVVPVSSATGQSYRCSMTVGMDYPQGVPINNLTAAATLAVWAFGGSAQESASTSRTFQVGNDQGVMSVVIDLTGPHDYLKCELYLAQGTLIADQASMMQVAPVNSSFEHGTTGWTWGTGDPAAPRGHGAIGWSSVVRSDALDGSSLGVVRTTDGSAIATAPVAAPSLGEARCSLALKTDGPSDAAFTGRLYAIRRSSTGAVVGYGSTAVTVRPTWGSFSAVAPDPGSKATSPSTVQCQFAPTSTTTANFDVARAGVRMTKLTNASLEGSAQGWSQPNGTVSVVGQSAAVLEGSSAVVATPATSYASLAQDNNALPGSHRCTVALRQYDGLPVDAVLTIWDLSRGRSSDARISLHQHAAFTWQVYSAQIDLAGPGLVRCELYLLTKNRPVIVDNASFT